MHLISSIDMHNIVLNRLKQKTILELPRIQYGICEWFCFKMISSTRKKDSNLALLHLKYGLMNAYVVMEEI